MKHMMSWLTAAAVLMGGASFGTQSHAEVLTSAIAGGKLCVTVNNNRIITGHCDGGDAQNWFTAVYGAQHYHGLCLDSETPQPGSQLVVRACNNAQSQHWATQPNGSYKNEAGWCMDISGGNPNEGVKIETWQCNNQAHQNWKRGPFGQAQQVQSGLSASAIATIKNAPPGTTFTILPGGNIVAAGGGNIVSAGGGNIVAAGGGN